MAGCHSDDREKRGTRPTPTTHAIYTRQTAHGEFSSEGWRSVETKDLWDLFEEGRFHFLQTT